MRSIINVPAYIRDATVVMDRLTTIGRSKHSLLTPIRASDSHKDFTLALERQMNALLLPFMRSGVALNPLYDMISCAALQEDPENIHTDYQRSKARTPLQSMALVHWLPTHSVLRRWWVIFPFGEYS